MLSSGRLISTSNANSKQFRKTQAMMISRPLQMSRSPSQIKQEPFSTLSSETGGSFGIKPEATATRESAAAAADAAAAAAAAEPTTL